MSELRIVRAEGDPFTRGRVVGRALRDLVNESLAFYDRYFSRRGVPSDQLEELLTPYLVSAEARFPAFLTTLKGMAEGATVPFHELFAVNAFEELEPVLEARGGQLLAETKDGRVPEPKGTSGSAGVSERPERCSTLTVSGPGGTIFGHNEQWLAADAANIAFVIDIPDDGSVPVAGPTIVACLPAVGVNGHGGVQGIDSLSAADDHVGVPRVIVSRSSLEAADRDDAIALAGTPARAGGYAHVLAFPDGTTFTVETTGRELAVLDGPGCHTNHYLDQRLAKLGAPPSAGSRSRLTRLQELVAERRPTDPAGVMEVLRDHAATPQSVCVHPDPADGDEAEAIMFSMVAEVDQRRLWVAPGNPCRSEFQEIDLDGVW